MATLVVALGLSSCSQIPQANANIAFMGDSITEFWWVPKTNFGISGNKTSQMLTRFPTEVLGHSFKVVVILGGTNDVRVPKIPIEQAASEAASNIEAMAALAESAKLDVVLCKIPPIEGLDARVEVLNGLIENIAAKHQYKLIDYYAPMVNHPEYFRDGEHPNDPGYFVMQAALTKVIPLDY